MTALHQRRWKIASVALALMVSSTVGCGRQGPPGMLWVTGTVLYEGQPLPEGAVHFLAQGKGSAGSSGSARLSNSRYGLYLAPGEYAVAIISEEGVAVMDRKTGRMIPAKSRIPEKYTAVTTSGLKATFDTGHRTADLSLAP
jgi:hypothetical protein